MTDAPLDDPSTTSRFFFDTPAAATEALSIVLLDARATKGFYRFSGLTVQQILVSGLLLEGRISGVVEKLEQVTGAVRTDE